MIAFGARKLRADDDGPKYLNTPETPLFKKSSVLYGADLARREISQRRQAVIVEGYTDVMACHLAGIGTAVATSGTSFGEGHIGILRRLLMDSDKFRGEVIFTFDGDAAGQKAALRAFSLEERFVTQTFVAVQPDGLDPCDLRLTHGDAAVRDLIAQRVPVFEFAIRSELAQHNLDTDEGRLAALDDAAKIVGRIKDQGLRDRYAISLDRWLGHDGRALRARARPAALRPGAEQRPGPAAGARPAWRPGRQRTGRQRTGRDGQAANGQAGSVPQPRDGDGPPYDLRDPVRRSSARRSSWPCSARPCAARRSTRSAPAASRRPPCTRPRSRSSAAAAGRARRPPAAGSGPSSCATPRPTTACARSSPSSPWSPPRAPRADGEPDARYASEVLARVEELAVSRQIAAIKSRLQRLNPVTEQGEYNRMFGDLVALEQRRKVLSGPAADALCSNGMHTMGRPEHYR